MFQGDACYELVKRIKEETTGENGVDLYRALGRFQECLDDPPQRKTKNIALY